MSRPNLIIFGLGFILTVLGITITLQEWVNLVLVFKAIIGPLIAVIGLVILFASTLKQP